MVRYEQEMCPVTLVSFILFPPPHAHFQSLKLTGVVSEGLGGFEKLTHLSCAIDSLGWLDLSGCITPVEVSCCFHPETRLFNCNSVHTLYINGMPPLQGLDVFVMLQELHYAACVCEFLNLRVCKFLRRVIFNNRDSLCTLNVITLDGCSALREFECSGMPSLRIVSLSACVELITLKCNGSSIVCLNLSDSPLLTSLDVSQPNLLRMICTNSNARLLYFEADDCPVLGVPVEVEQIPGEEIEQQGVGKKHGGVKSCLMSCTTMYLPNA